MFEFFFESELFDFGSLSTPVTPDVDVAAAIDSAVPPLTGVVEVIDAPADAIGPLAPSVTDGVTPTASTGAANAGSGVSSDLAPDPSSLAGDSATAECAYCQPSDITLGEPVFVWESSDYGSDYFFS